MENNEQELVDLAMRWPEQCLNRSHSNGNREASLFVGDSEEHGRFMIGVTVAPKGFCDPGHCEVSLALLSDPTPIGLGDALPWPNKAEFSGKFYSLNEDCDDHRVAGQFWANVPVDEFAEFIVRNPVIQVGGPVVEDTPIKVSAPAASNALVGHINTLVGNYMATDQIFNAYEQGVEDAREFMDSQGYEMQRRLMEGLGITDFSTIGFVLKDRVAVGTHILETINVESGLPAEAVEALMGQFHVYSCMNSVWLDGFLQGVAYQIIKQNVPDGENPVSFIQEFGQGVIPNDASSLAEPEA